MVVNTVLNELEYVLLNSEKPSEWFEKLRSENGLDRYFPEVKALIGIPQNQFHHLEGDAWTHTMMVLDEAAKRRDIVRNALGFMLSALCHDFGKAVSTTISDDGTVHSYKHEEEGLPLVQAFLERIGADNELTRYVLNMTELHMEPNILASARSKLKKTNKLFDISAEPFDLIQLAVCDGLGKLPQYADTEKFLIERYESFKEIMARPYVHSQDLIDSGITDTDLLNETLLYAHKLRLAGLSKDDQLRQSIAYARTMSGK